MRYYLKKTSIIFYYKKDYLYIYFMICLIKKCKLCKKEFNIEISGNNQYCSSSCRLYGRSIVQKKYRSKNSKRLSDALQEDKKWLINFQYNRYVRMAKKRGIDFNIKKWEVYQFFKKRCHYCHGNIKIFGLDRIDSLKGYTLYNVVSCCGNCNMMKRVQTYNDFIDVCKRIAKNH